MTTTAYIIVGICMLLAAAGLIWCALLMKKGDEPSDETSGEEEKNDR